MQPITQSVIDDTISLTAELIELTLDKQTTKDKRRNFQFSRLVNSKQAIETTMHLTDEIIRISSPNASAKILRQISNKVLVKDFGLFDYIGIKLLSILSFIAPRFVKFVIINRVRLSAQGIILNSHKAQLKKHIKNRAKDNIALNINLLGEAVLGEEEANQRFQAVLSVMKLEDVTYISVKISSIVSQLIAADHLGSIERVAQKLRVIYQHSIKEKCFVNLDMEEYRDLQVTIDVFKKLLDEEQFQTLYAGIVLQAYLPDSHKAFADITSWAKDRYEKTGGRIKIRLVKGANLAMERTEAELQGWEAAPYPTKKDVDASYIRLINTAISKEYENFLVIGLASHNLFHIAYAQTLVHLRDTKKQLEIEMLEGMANAEALAIKKKIGSVLLYSPITSNSEFPAAVAYLVRRLDENTSEENYLKASFNMKVGNKQFNLQKQRFVEAVHMATTVNITSHRRADHNRLRAELFQKNIFINQANRDLTDTEYVASIININKDNIFNTALLPVVIGDKEYLHLKTKNGVEPSKNGKVFYTYNVANEELIDQAVKIAKAEQVQWGETSVQTIKEIIGPCAVNMELGRARLTAVMMKDGGKTIAEADPEISEAIDFARFYALSAQHLDIQSQPLGLVVIVPPWNFPYAIPAGGIFAALVAGNAVIFKPAPETVLIAWELVNQLWSAGIPKTLLHFIPTEDNEVGKKLITHKDVDAVVLTGSYQTALLFQTWKPTLRLLAETSGKNSIIVSASADIDNAVKDIVQSAFAHAGQKCSAASLAIVQADVYEHPFFFKQLKDAISTIQVGDSSHVSTFMGPLISPPQDSLMRALTTLEDGEQWLIKPQRLNEYTWTPGVKINVQPHSWTHHTEWFGPVLGVMKAPNLQTAIQWQNNVTFGLTAGLHALDIKECEHWINTVEAGNLYINRGITGAVVNRQPFGGWKKSSFGPTAKAGGEHYVSLFRNYQILHNVQKTKKIVTLWWKIFNKPQKISSTIAERNFIRYIPHENALVVVDEAVPQESIQFVKWIAQLLKIKVSLISTNDILKQKHYFKNNQFTKIRWLAHNSHIPDTIFTNATVDQRKILQNGKIELLLWLKEQSISITNHRYGNVGAGPQIMYHW